MSIYDKLKSPEFYSYVRLKVKNHLSNIYYVGKTDSKEKYKYQESWKLEKINDFTHDIYCNLLDLKNDLTLSICDLFNVFDCFPIPIIFSKLMLLLCVSIIT